jgi:hypothetical protein
MSRKHFSWLLGITLVVGILLLLMPGKTGRDAAPEPASRLLPQLQSQVNELDWIRVSRAGGESVATLRRADDRWVVDEASAYHADWDKLRSLLAELAQAEVAEAKTDNPAYYDRLGVEDVAAADASGVQIAFAEASGLPAVIVGNSAQGRGGQYVRLQGVAQSVLLDRRLSVPRERMEWVEREIIHVPDAEVVEVEIRHADGERLRSLKTSADDENFVLQEIPDGQEAKSAWTVDSLANGLASLQLDDVKPAATIDWNSAIRYALVTADGLRVDADLADLAVTGGDEEEAEHEYWVRLEAGVYQTAVDSAVETAMEDGGAAQRAAAINDRVRGWAYRIPKYKFDGMSKRLADLLQPVEADES